MRYRSAVLLLAAALGFWGVLRALRPFKQYQAAEYEDFPLPLGWDQKTEWTRARLRYPSVYGARWELDLNRTIDHPRSDRHLLQGLRLRRLTRIDTRWVEQIVDLDRTDVWALAVYPRDGNTAYAGTAGGVFAITFGAEES